MNRIHYQFININYISINNSDFHASLKCYIPKLVKKNHLELTRIKNNLPWCDKKTYFLSLDMLDSVRNTRHDMTLVSINQMPPTD